MLSFLVQHASNDLPPRLPHVDYSSYVLVKNADYIGGYVIAYYDHYVEEWFDGFGGSFYTTDVEAWWYLPEYKEM